MKSKAMFRSLLILIGAGLLVWTAGGSRAQAPSAGQGAGGEQTGALSMGVAQGWGPGFASRGAPMSPTAAARLPRFEPAEDVPARGYEDDLEFLKGQALPDGSAPRAVNDVGATGFESGPSAPVLDTNFQGVGYTGSFPPDPIIAAGPDHVIQAVNRSFRISQKSGSTVSTTTFASWWSGFFTGTNPFDPWIHYDQHSQRWVMLTVATDSSTLESWYLISTSFTSNPTGTWCVWGLRSDVDSSTDTSNWSDYPKLGLDDTNFYITSNQFSFAGSIYQYSKLRIMNKSQFYNNSCGAIQWYDFWNILNADGTDAFTIQPALTFGTPGAEYMVNSRSGSGSNVTLWTVTGTWPGGAAPVLTRDATIPVGVYNAPPDAQQSGSATRVDTGDARLLNAVYRNGSLYTTHTIQWNTVDSRARYLVIDTASRTATLDVAYGADGTFYYYPAVMPNALGDIFTVFHRSSSTEFAGVRYTWQPTSATAFEGSALLKGGEASYVRLDGIGRNRWGDYSGVALDPSSTSQVWVYGEYAESSVANTWGTWVGLLGEACPSSVALQGAPDAKSIQNTLYQLRDGAMSATPLGRWYVEQFYRHAPEASRLLLEDADLRAGAQAMLSRLGPKLSAVSKGRPASLSEDDLRAVEQLAWRFAIKGSWQLRYATLWFVLHLRTGALMTDFGVALSD